MKEIDDSIFSKFLEDLSEISKDITTFSQQSVRMVLDESKDEHWDLAEEIYNEIRSDITDVQKISENIKKTERIVLRVKKHLFYEEHLIVSSDVLEKRRLDADPEIVNSWCRLRDGDFVESDLRFFEHEQVESIIEKRKQLTYKQAHLETEALGYVWKPEEAYDGNPGKS